MRTFTSLSVLSLAVVVSMAMTVLTVTSHAQPLNEEDVPGTLFAADFNQEDAQTVFGPLNPNSILNKDKTDDSDDIAQQQQLLAFSQQYPPVQTQGWPWDNEPDYKGSCIGPDSASSSRFNLWYCRPAKSVRKDGLLLGNGKLSVLVPGHVNTERLFLNDQSCWTGGPNAYTDYRGGNVAPEESLAQIERVKAFQERVEHEPVRLKDDQVQDLKGNVQGFGRQVGIGQLVVEELYPFKQVDNYQRRLDLDTGTVSVTFSVGNVKYTREHWCSFPESVCVMRMNASEPRQINLRVALDVPNHPGNYTNVHNRLIFQGSLESNGLSVEAQVGVKTEGSGVSMANPRQVVAINFDAVTIYYSFGTGWNPAGFPGFANLDPHERLTGVVDKAMTLWYGDQYAKHLTDYQGLFKSFEVDFGMPASYQWPTDELLKKIREGDDKLNQEDEAFFEILLVQYGRYLAIVSARAGGVLPFTGQFGWVNEQSAKDKEPDEDVNLESYYKMNINLQMNYWLSESTGLGETVMPLLDYIEKLLMPRGADTAKLYFGTTNNRGWTTFPYSNIWAHTGPISEPETSKISSISSSFYFPTTAAWLCQHAWDRYQYSQDYYYLRDHAYKMMSGAAQFWIDALVTKQADESTNTPAYLLASPSFSPEHGRFTRGSAIDQQLIWQLFNNTLEAISIVGEKDKAFTKNLTDAMAILSPGLKVGAWNQLQEWDEDMDQSFEGHRHLAPFYAVYPGRQILAQSPLNSDENSTEAEKRQKALVEAAIVLLESRGSGVPEGNLGWPKTWRAAVWARLGNGRKAFEALELFKKTNVLNSNLVPTGDKEGSGGQIGYGAALLEILIQSPRPGYIVALGSVRGLPGRWLDGGKVRGFKSREGHTIGVEWKQGQMSRLELVAVKAGSMKIRIGTLDGSTKRGDEPSSSDVRVVVNGSKAVAFVRQMDSIMFDVSKGQTYVVEVDVGTKV